MDTKIYFKKAQKEDTPLILKLVKKLAEFELAPEEVTVSEIDYLENGFNEHPLFECNLIYVGEELAGFCLWYFRFSTWKGKRLYVEDLYIEEKFRNNKLGTVLLEEAIEEAKRTKCTGLMWQVLDWNTNAIEFYKKYKAKFDSGWINVHLNL
jgi:GNAT superfamily N-acetyltransferase